MRSPDGCRTKLLDGGWVPLSVAAPSPMQSRDRGGKRAESDRAECGNRTLEIGRKQAPGSAGAHASFPLIPSVRIGAAESRKRALAKSAPKLASVASTRRVADDRDRSFRAKALVTAWARATAFSRPRTLLRIRRAVRGLG